MSDHIPDEIVEKLWEELNVGAPPSRGHLRRALEAILPDIQQPRAGEMHEIDQAFYDLTVKERDFERGRADRLTAERDRAREQVERLEDALDAAQLYANTPQCEAVCYSGPGHQSRFRCDLPAGHDVELKPHQYSEVRFEWTEDGECVD